MAEMLTTPTTFEKPAGTQPAVSDVVVHVIPEEFHGAALHKKVVPPSAPSQPQSTPPLPPRPLPPGAPKKPTKRNKAVIISIVISVILVLAVGGYFSWKFVFSKQSKTVCGNNSCEVGETAVSCAVDCAPKVLCGDGRCDVGETTQSCSVDCKPLSVCGDTKCDSDESFTTCPVDCKPVSRCGDTICDADETSESCAVDCAPKAPQAGLDSESDGLTDLEEQAIYGSDSTKTDTDSDTFVDLNEVVNLFDPTKFSPAPLRENQGIALYTTSPAWSLLYPRGWTVREDSANGTTIFTAPTGESVQVLTQKSTEGQQLSDWYVTQVPGVTKDQVQMFKTKRGYDLIMSSNRMTAYTQSGNTIYTLSYILGGQTQLQFKATFQMMVNSLLTL